MRARSLIHSVSLAWTVAPEYRQFDFWVGDWDVRAPDGKTAGST